MTARRKGVSRHDQPPSTQRKAAKFTRSQISDFANLHKDVPPADR
jgi:hypothetical protein